MLRLVAPDNVENRYVFVAMKGKCHGSFLPEGIHTEVQTQVLFNSIEPH